MHAASTSAPRIGDCMSSALKAALEREGWDGEWYRRAYFDDGTPLGSATNAECRIDSIAQSWGVISGPPSPLVQRSAMAAVEKYLVRRPRRTLLCCSPRHSTSAARSRATSKAICPACAKTAANTRMPRSGRSWLSPRSATATRPANFSRCLNPINHASTRADIHRYKVEPYVVAGDIYAEPPHVGRGGWTWYTGSAGWMYRAGIEWILGFRLRGTRLYLDPCIPHAWRSFEITFRYHSARYEIVVENPQGVMRGVSSVELDGVPLASGSMQIPLVDDGATHPIRVVLGSEGLLLMHQAAIPR